MSRRSLQNRVHATTPLRFLQRLELITEVEEHRAGFVPALEMYQETSAFEGNASPIFIEFLVNQDAESSEAIETDNTAMLTAADQLPGETDSDRNVSETIPAESGERIDSRRVPTTNRVEVDVDFSDANVAQQDVTDKVESTLSVQPVTEIVAQAPDLSTTRSSESIAQLPDAHWSSIQRDTPVDADAETGAPLINDAALENGGLAFYDNPPVEEALRESLPDLPTLVPAKPPGTPVEIGLATLSQEDAASAVTPLTDTNDAASFQPSTNNGEVIPISTPLPDGAPFDVAIDSVGTASAVPMSRVLIVGETPTLSREPLPRRGRIEELPLDRRTVDGKSKSTETAPPVVEELFSKRDGVDRSPAAWAARLAKAFESPSERNRLNLKNEEVAPENRGEISTTQERNVSPRASRKVEQRDSILRRDSPIVVPEGTRRFLRPLIGMDPSTVPIHQGPAAAEITSMNAADGVSAGGTVALSPDQAAGTPEYLGLLAHELTHVARHRQSRFVPPIARNDSRSSLSGTFTEDAAEHLDEETLARRVEARVVLAAENEAASDSVRSFDNSPGQSSDLLDEDSTLGPPPLQSTDADRWGGLPAPWEPLPDWVLALPDSSASAGESINVVDTGLAAFGTTDRGLPLARAEEGRMLDDPVPSAVPAVKTETAKPIAQDLDLLARQVYATLRRRLEAERRRQPF